jgi:putative hemolysin
MQNRLWIVVLIALIALAVSACTKTEAQPVQTETGNTSEYCVDASSGAQMSYEQAAGIAESSTCGEQGRLEETHFCNTETGTWWIDLNIDKPGCNPACVVNVNDGSAEINWRCTGALPPKETEAPTGGGDIGLANPASVHCTEQGYELDMRSDETGGQFGVCVFPDGSECDEWAFFRGECGPATAAGPTPLPTTEEPVEDWAGLIISNPTGAQFDDYFERQSFEDGSYGIDSMDPEIRERIVALRDTGTTVRIWGKLHRNVPDVDGTQIIVTRLEVQAQPAPSPVAEEAVEGWVGRLVMLPHGSQINDSFEREDGQKFGIAPLGGGDQVRALIEENRWTGAQVEVWGTMVTGIPDMENRQIQVERIKALSGPAAEARNLALFATASASSVLPSDRWGTYHAWSANDGLLSTPWSEGVDGAGVGEWIMLEFPGTIEIQGIGVSVGYDRDADDKLRSPEVFGNNNRLKRATLIFSNGERTTVDFADTRGVQVRPLVRAPGPNIQTDSVKLVIEEVYPGALYDDTCIAEIEVWGVTK